MFSMSKDCSSDWLFCCRGARFPMLAFQLVFMTSEPREIVLGLVRIGIPYRVAFLFSTTFRFVPLLLSELEGMKEAQRLRGVDIDNSGVVRKLTVLGAPARPTDHELPDQGPTYGNRAASEGFHRIEASDLPQSLA